MPLASVIFQQQFSDINAFRAHLVQFQYNELYQETQPIESVHEILKTYNNMLTRTVALSVEEPAGYSPLGYLIVMFASELTRSLGRQFFYHNQYTVADNKKREANPSTDTALVSLVDSFYKPEALFEYKPVINPDVEREDGLKGYFKPNMTPSIMKDQQLYTVLLIYMYGSIGNTVLSLRHNHLDCQLLRLSGTKKWNTQNN